MPVSQRSRERRNTQGRSTSRLIVLNNQRQRLTRSTQDEPGWNPNTRTQRYQAEGHGRAADSHGGIDAISGADAPRDITASAEVSDPCPDQWSALPSRARRVPGPGWAQPSSSAAPSSPSAVFQTRDTGVTATDVVDAFG